MTAVKWIGDNIIALLALVVAVTNAAYALISAYRGRRKIVLAAQPTITGFTDDYYRDRALIRRRAVNKDVGVENIRLVCDDPAVETWGGILAHSGLVPAEFVGDPAKLFDHFSPARVVSAHSVSSWSYEWTTARPELEQKEDSVWAEVTLTDGKVIKSNPITLRRSLVPFRPGT